MTTNLPSTTRKILLLLAGLGVLGALALIGLGLVLFFSRTTQPPSEAAPDVVPGQTATVSVPTPTLTVMADIVVLASATSATETSTPQPQITATGGITPTATRRPTNTPTPSPVPQQRPPTITVDGFLELIEPLNEAHVLSSQVVFQWKWHNNKGCEPPPQGYAFEIRIWLDNDVSGPMGAMNAQLEQEAITCDPNSGTRSFTVGNIRSVPGAAGQSSGRLRWDVALVKLDPYEPVITTQYRTFYH